MPNQGHKSNKFDAAEELVLMRMGIKAMRDRLNEDLDAMAEQLDRLLPARDESINKCKKNWTSREWGEFLDGKKL